MQSIDVGIWLLCGEPKEQKLAFYWQGRKWLTRSFEDENMKDGAAQTVFNMTYAYLYTCTLVMTMQKGYFINITSFTSIYYALFSLFMFRHTRMKHEATVIAHSYYSIK